MPDIDTGSAPAATPVAAAPTPVVEAPASAPPAVQSPPASQAPAPSGAPVAEAPAADDKAYWPEDWRQKYAGEDEKKLKKLERYGSPQAALDALFNAQSRISSGELKSALKADATPEELTAWREENGVPLEATGYDLALPDGLVVGEADRPFVDDFLRAAHEGNFKQEEVSKALGWFFNKQEAAVAEQAQRDDQSRTNAFDTLREEFGPEYKKEVKIAFSVLDSVPQEFRDKLLGGRMADGTLVGDSPDVIRWLNTISRELNPIGTVVPGSGSNAVQAVEAEINNLKGMMGDRKSEYWKGPKAEKNQARYRELTTAMSKGR